VASVLIFLFIAHESKEKRLLPFLVSFPETQNEQPA